MQGAPVALVAKLPTAEVRPFVPYVWQRESSYIQEDTKTGHKEAPHPQAKSATLRTATRLLLTLKDNKLPSCHRFNLRTSYQQQRRSTCTPRYRAENHISQVGITRESTLYIPREAVSRSSGRINLSGRQAPTVTHTEAMPDRGAWPSDEMLSETVKQNSTTSESPVPPKVVKTATKKKTPPQLSNVTMQPARLPPTTLPHPHPLRPNLMGGISPVTHLQRMWKSTPGEMRLQMGQLANRKPFPPPKLEKSRPVSIDLSSTSSESGQEEPENN